ncbi:holin [Kitasatospora sp. GP82]|uniref:holin n=1 Tax=Kitasatospora sp. GP82 TaxID=3035089 RepID=UPI0024741FA5|nr:holin [Kitasatospora sp. GP82]MDH6126754.1 5-methylcytosine-specific restriction protein A [Kitasatospora sp. GP82]
MTRRRAYTVCTVAGCPEYTTGGRCDDHRREAERRRGTARQHEREFRTAVLAHDPLCKLCGTAPSKHTDHYPLSRRELVAAGRDPNDPQHGRGLCASCHSVETARHQPGGWAGRDGG